MYLDAYKAIHHCYEGMEVFVRMRKTRYYERWSWALLAERIPAALLRRVKHTADAVMEPAFHWKIEGRQ